MSAWFESSWRPQKSSIVYKNVPTGDLKKGAVIDGRFHGPIGFHWKQEVVNFEWNRVLESKFNSFFKGTETITVEERGNGIKVAYLMRYELLNPIYQILWTLLLEERFVKEMHQALEVFKENCQKEK